MRIIFAILQKTFVRFEISEEVIDLTLTLTGAKKDYSDLLRWLLILEIKPTVRIGVVK